MGTIVANSASSAEWRVTPRLAVDETYTDNVRLAPRGQEQSDFVTELSPGVTVTARGARLQLQADYAFQYRHYLSNSDGNGHNHSLSSTALWDAWNRELFLQGSATITQQNISPLGQVAASNANITQNRTEIRQAMVSPYWVRRLGNWANLDARYIHSRTSTSSESFDVYNSETNTGSITVSSGPAFGNLGWSVNHRQSETQSSQGAFENRESQSTVANARYLIFPTFAVTGSVGYEDSDFTDRRGGKTSGSIWSVGADWAPSPRTRLSGSFGERYFGNTYKLDFSHRTRLTTWTIGYSEDITDEPFTSAIPISADTAASVDRLFVSRIPDPRERQIAVQTFIAQNALPTTLASPILFPTTQVTLTKRWHGGVGLLGTRSTLFVNVFREERQNLSTGNVVGPFDPFAISNTVEQTGYGTVFSYRLSAITTATASVAQSRNRYTDVAREDTDTHLRVGLMHQVHPKIHAAVNFRYVDRSSDDVLSDYREKAIVGSLRMTF